MMVGMRTRRMVCGVLVCSVVASVFAGPPTAQAEPAFSKKRPSVPGMALNQPGKVPVSVDRMRGAVQLPTQPLPAATSTIASFTETVDLTASTTKRRQTSAVTVARATGAKGKASVAKVKVTGRAALAGGKETVLVSVAADTDQQVTVSVDAKAAGVDPTRAQVFLVSDCAAADLSGCSTQPIATTVTDGQVQATLQTSPTAQTLAVTTGASGSDGNFAAVPFNPSSTWAAGGASGDFTWAYPMRTPAVASGVAATVGLSYSSSAVDGRTSSANNQASWVGEGFDLASGGITRSYLPCSQDMTGSNTTTKTGDLCWGGDNLFASFDGHSGELVQIGTSGVYRLRDDDGTRFQRNTAATNGVAGGEFWVMTTTDGTDYTFGDSTTSAWTVPVVGNQPGEPGYQTAYASSFTTQAWAWKLTNVTDPSGNAIKYTWATETNRYGKNNNTSGVASYVRGGYLTQIDYGYTAGNLTTVAAQVAFTVTDRCSSTTSCATTVSNQVNWPDVPLDQICTSTTSCPTQTSPTFFTMKKLSKVTTNANTASGLAAVEFWDLTYQYPTPGDGTRPSLWLSKIEHGVTGDTYKRTTTFAGQPLANRVDGAETGPGMVADPFNKYRLSTINTEDGAQIIVSYTPQQCTLTSVATILKDNNTSRCFPAKYQPQGYDDSYWHWFHRYAVTRIVVNDLTGASAEPLVTDYSYGTPGWRYDDIPGVVDADRSWSQFAGYTSTTTTSGPTSEAPVKSTTTWYRGRNGDKNADGTTKTVTVAGNGVTDTDDWWKSGTARETIRYNGAAVVGRSITTVGALTKVATAPDGRIAGHAATLISRQVTVLAAGGTRTTESTSTVDAYGNTTLVDDQGDISTTADDRCTKSLYAANTTDWLTSYVYRIQARTGRCSAFPATATTENTLTEQRIYYDKQTLGLAPVKGQVTSSDQGVSVAGGMFAFESTSKTTYDALGRPITSTDPAGNITTTTYTQTNFRPTQISATGPDPDGAGPLTALTATTTMDPIWGTVTKLVDAGGEITEATVDAWGRTTQVWSPRMPRASFLATPSQRFTYQWPGTNQPAGVMVEEYLAGPYKTTVTLYDGMSRLRETQVQAIDQYVDANGAVIPTVGRVVSGARVDSRGLTTVTSGGVLVSGAPSFTLSGVSDVNVESQTRTTYDGAARPTAVNLYGRNTLKWTAESYTYGGDRTTVKFAQGKMPVTTVVDARGQTSQVQTWRTTAMTADDFDQVSYSYTPGGQLSSMTDAGNNSWTYTYDLRGRQTSVKDPNAAAPVTTTYNSRGLVETTTDANTKTLQYGYDNLARKTSLREGSASGPLLSTWGYTAKGYQDTTTRYLGTAQYITKIDSFTPAGDPIQVTTTVPTVTGVIDAALSGTYTTNYSFRRDGRISTVATSAYKTGVPAETLTYGYDELGRLSGYDGNTVYLGDVVWSALDQVKQTQQQNTTNQGAWFTTEYDPVTNQQTRSFLDRQMLAGTDADLKYAWDQTGHLTALSATNTTSGTVVDTQCFTRDHQQRLTQAWTTSATTCGTPTFTGPAPYRYSWTYDPSNNRTSQTEYTTATATTTTTSTFPTPGAANPHHVTALSLVTSANPTTPVTTSYTYDNAGNTTQRWTGNAVTSGGTFATSTLTYNSEGRLAQAVTGSKTSTYTYDTTGKRLTRRDNTTTTLYLGDVELSLNQSTGAITATRYYTFNGATIAVRTGTTNTQVAWNFTDLNNTGTWQIRSTDSTITTRRTTPYGTPRGGNPTWAGQQGFVAGLKDNDTGFTRLGARDYDPHTGRFLTIDPLLTPGSPLEWNPYQYGAWDPTINPDPTGLKTCLETCNSRPHGVSAQLSKSQWTDDYDAAYGPQANTPWSSGYIANENSRPPEERRDNRIVGAIKFKKYYKHNPVGTDYRPPAKLLAQNLLEYHLLLLMLAGAGGAGAEAGTLSRAKTNGAAAANTGTSALDSLTPAVRANVEDAISRAASGKVRFTGHDGKVYSNSDGLLPRGGSYTEWTAAESGAKRGAHRVIIEGDPASPSAIYYWDHLNPPVRIGP